MTVCANVFIEWGWDRIVIPVGSLKPFFVLRKMKGLLMPGNCESHPSQGGWVLASNAIPKFLQYLPFSFFEELLYLQKKERLTHEIVFIQKSKWTNVLAV